MYSKRIDDVYKELNTTDDGLSSSEAKARIEKYGLNKLRENKGRSTLNIFADQFKDLMIIILILVDIFMLFYAIFVNGDYIDFIVITFVIFINAIMGFLQENKAEVTLKNLMQYNKTQTQVKRDNKFQIIDSENLVKGDVVTLNAGDVIPADIRIVKCSNLTVDESALTGESVSILKNNKVLSENLQIQDMSNMLFSGTVIATGSVEGVVVNTGMDTELGKIAKSLNTPYRVETPLELRIKELSKKISVLIFLILIFIFIYSTIKGIHIVDTIMLAISLAVAAIPEGLPAVITICLSNGTNAMFKKKTIVRQINSIETIGSLNVICSDKTGTITQNKMSVKDMIIYDEVMLYKVFALCNDGLIDNNSYIGDPTETCLYECLKRKDIDVISTRKKYKRIDCIPFDSVRKMMATLNKIDETYYLLVKGSNKSVIDKCKYIYKDNKKVLLTSKEKKNLYDEISNMQDKALRVMSFAYRSFADKPDDITKSEKELILAGIVGIIDPPREDVKKAINDCKKASIRPIMITGDSLNTASAVAISVGIINSKEEAIEGSELDNYDDNQLVDIINKYSVYARVNPKHKERIVHILQKNNKVVAMTGDGVNDAPAIKDADVGIGMGITGTDVTKNVSDIILLDDSFSTIVSAVEEGRRIYSNIRKNIVYSLSSNMAEIFIVLISLLTGTSMLLPIHILFIDLVTDSIPSIALSFEPIEKNTMSLKPNSKKKKLFTPFILSSIISSSFIETLFVVLSYILVSHESSEVVSTVVLLSLIIQEILYAISVRNLKKPIIQQGVFSNKAMNIGIIALIIVEIIFFATPLRRVISIVPISFELAFQVILLNLFAFVVYEMIKIINVRAFKD